MELIKRDPEDHLKKRIERAFKEYEASLERYPDKGLFTAERLENEISQAVENFHTYLIVEENKRITEAILKRKKLKRNSGN